MKMDEWQTMVSKLHQTQQQTQMQMARWSSDIEQFMADCHSEDKHAVLCKKIQGLETTVENQIKMQKQATRDDKQLLRDLQAEVELMRTKKAAEDKMIKMLMEELEHLYKERQSVRDAPESETIEEKIKRLEEEECVFKKHLATEIRKVKGGFLQIVFTNIDHNKPESSFFFTVKLDDSRNYIVGDCQPEISDMGDLVKKLNSSNDFHTFVQTIRKRFKEMATK